ncbi:hypothetical protein [Algicella marina]|uniref:Uncharacterized protein n=1 Tax=Algicella marina TaxID=2683284 RepID=A0A6P1SXX9_9RHOB|nr:hypothetical protein [Algicella marina]QHQ33839.1 hypothetical protein GO499_00915 [Algicella marina]
MNVDAELKMMSTDKLRKLVQETEETLGDIKQEIERRENAAQAREIEHLDVHMKNAELSLETIRNFFRYLREEMRKD